MIFCKEFFCGYVCVCGVSKLINLCAACDEILFIWICLCG